MYRVMIVDDESHVHHLLEKEVNWEENGFTVAFNAANGLQALKEIESGRKYDIILTDLNMPVMDGFKLIEKLSLKYPDIVLVVLSVYSDYKSIRKAFQLGAVNYILKFEIEDSYVTTTLINAMKKKKFITRHEELSAQFNAALCGEGDLSEIGHIFENCRMILCVCDPCHNLDVTKNGKVYLPNTAIMDICSDALVGYPDRLITILNGCAVILLRINKPVHAKEKLLWELSQVADSINRKAAQKYRCRISFALSDCFSDIHMLKEQYLLACERMSAFFLNENAKLYYQDLPDREMAFPDIHKKVHELCEAVTSNKPELAERTLNEIAAEIRSQQIKNREAVIIYYVRLVYFTRESLSKKGLNVGWLFQESESICNNLISYETLNGINSCVKELFAKICTLCSETGLTRDERLILRAKRYMEEHFSEDINLKNVSQQVGLSESYFSSLFVKVTGVSFSSYLTHLRISEAKRMLISSDARIYEVASKCGYYSAEHFSRVFKKITGVSPADYKINHSNKKIFDNEVVI